MPFAQLMAVLPLRDVACSLRVPSNPNGLKYNKDENETVIAHRSDCGLFLFRQKKGVRQWMSNSKLIELSYYDPSAQVRLSAYADTLVLDHDQNGSIISAIRFGGYPEMVRAMADAIYGGATIEAAQNDTTRMLQSSLKSYQRQITHDGIYAVATLMAADTVQEDRSGKHEKDEDTNLVDTEQMELQPRRCYIFCPARDQKRLFEELDHKTAAPLIPEFQDYVLSSLRQRGDLRQRMDAWVLDLKPQDQNVVEVLEQGLQSGDIQIPGAVPNMPDGFENVENVTGYLNTFGVTVADRIRNQFMPLFDPAKEPLSDEVLAINDCIMSRVGYSLYDAQLAVAEAVKRQLARKRVALIIAVRLLLVLCTGCGPIRSGKAAGNPLASSCVPPMSHKSGCGRLEKRSRIPTAWWCARFRISTVCMRCTRRATKVYLLFFPRSRRGMAICVTPPCVGIDADARFSAQTATV